MTRSILDPDTLVIVAVKEASVAAFAIMIYREKSAHLNLLAVKPKHRRFGIGKILIEWLELSALNAGTFQLPLEVRENNRAAQTFYASLGYTQGKVIPGYYRNTEAAMRMTKNLSILSNSHPGV